jgi:hypothetical protein
MNISKGSKIVAKKKTENALEMQYKKLHHTTVKYNTGVLKQAAYLNIYLCGK